MSLRTMSFIAWNISRRGRIVLALVIVIIWLMVSHHVSRMDRQFFRASLPGLKGLVLYELGDYKGAAAAYRTHLQEEFLSGHTSGDPARDAFMRGELKAAQQLALKTLYKKPMDLDAMLLAGEILLEEGSPDQALPYFREVLKLMPRHRSAILLEALAYTRIGLYDSAVDSLKLLLRMFSTRAWETGFLATLAAIGELEEIPQGKRPLCLLAHYHRTLLAFDRTNARNVASYANQALAGGDRPDEAHVTLGVVAYKEDRKDEALREFQSAIRANSANADAYHRASLVFSDRGDLANELEMLELAVQYAPDDAFYETILMEHLIDKLQDYQKALRLAEGQIERSPHDHSLLSRLGKIYVFLGEHEEALAQFRKALLLAPRNAEYQEGIAFTLHELNRVEESIEAYKVAISMDPRLPSAHAGLGAIYARMQNESKTSVRSAIVEIEKAIQLGYDDIDTLLYLCVAYLNLASYDQAATCYDQVLARDRENPVAISGYWRVRSILEGQRRGSGR